MSAPGQSSPKHGAGNTIGTYQDSTRPDYDEATETDAKIPPPDNRPGAIPASEQTPKTKPE